MKKILNIVLSGKVKTVLCMVRRLQEAVYYFLAVPVFYSYVKRRMAIAKTFKSSLIPQLFQTKKNYNIKSYKSIDIYHLCRGYPLSHSELLIF